MKTPGLGRAQNHVDFHGALTLCDDFGSKSFGVSIQMSPLKKGEVCRKTLFAPQFHDYFPAHMVAIELLNVAIRKIQVYLYVYLLNKTGSISTELSIDDI